MYLLTYLQTTYHFSRRTIVDFIKQEKILVNQLPVQSFKYELQSGDEITLPDGKSFTFTSKEPT
jgi:RNA-binding protein YlmH